MSNAHIVILALLGIPTLVILIALAVKKMGWKNFFLTIFLLIIAIGSTIFGTMWYTESLPSELPAMPNFDFFGMLNWLIRTLSNGQTATMVVVIALAIGISWVIGFRKVLGLLWTYAWLVIPGIIILLAFLYGDQLPILGGDLGIGLPMTVVGIIGFAKWSIKAMMGCLTTIVLLVVGFLALIYFILPNLDNQNWRKYAVDAQDEISEQLQRRLGQIDFDALYEQTMSFVTSNTSSSETPRNEAVNVGECTAIVVVSDPSGANIRLEPSIRSRIIGSILSDETVQVVTDTVEGWTNVSYNGTTGWMADSLLTNATCN